MKGIIIVNGYALADGIKHQVRRLSEEFALKGVEIEVRKNNELIAYIENGDIKTSLGKCDFIVYLDKDRFVARMLTKLGYRLFNNAEAIELCDDKMLTHIALSNYGLNMPLTISSTLCYRDDGNRDFLKHVEDKLSFPLIVKENYGSLGKQVYLVNNSSELQNIADKLIHTPHLYQEFIESSKGKDYRLVVIAHRVIAYMERVNTHSYLSNLACGGEAHKVEIPDSYKEAAIKASEILGLDYCGVDILEGANHEPIISEVNSNAFYEGIEKTTGVNVAKIYVEHIINSIK